MSKLKFNAIFAIAWALFFLLSEILFNLLKMEGSDIELYSWWCISVIAFALYGWFYPKKQWMSTSLFLVCLLSALSHSVLIIYYIITQYYPRTHEFYDAEGMGFFLYLYVVPTTILGIGAFLISAVIRGIIQRHALPEESRP